MPLRLLCLSNRMVCNVVMCLCSNLLIGYLWELLKIMSNLKWYSNCYEMMFSCVVIETQVVGQHYVNENSICEYVVDYVMWYYYFFIGERWFLPFYLGSCDVENTFEWGTLLFYKWIVSLSQWMDQIIWWFWSS